MGRKAEGITLGILRADQKAIATQGFVAKSVKRRKSAQSTAVMTFVASTIACASFHLASFKFFAELFVITETISAPPGSCIVISEFTGP
jgi:hypothetical protein